LLVAFLNQQFVINAFRPEFIFNNGNALPMVFRQQALKQGGFTGAEKASKDGDGHHIVNFQTGGHNSSQHTALRGKNRFPNHLGMHKKISTCDYSTGRRQEQTVCLVVVFQAFFGSG